jgi:hypothetical protein
VNLVSVLDSLIKFKIQSNHSREHHILVNDSSNASMMEAFDIVSDGVVDMAWIVGGHVVARTGCRSSRPTIPH